METCREVCTWRVWSLTGDVDEQGRTPIHCCPDVEFEEQLRLNRALPPLLPPPSPPKKTNNPHIFTHIPLFRPLQLVSPSPP